MADLTDLQAAASTKIVGSDSTGLETNAVGADSNNNLQVIDYADGPVTPGTVAARSSLAGGQFNTTLPTLTTTQQCALQLDSRGRLIVTTQAANDTNYGTVGANTLRTASQIGNAAGAADFNAGTTSAQTLRVSANITRNGTELDYNFGTVGANTLRTASQLGNATGAADFNAGAAGAQTLRVTVANLPTTLDTNYGTVGASTLRTASQIGNATGAAAFNAGTTSAQTLRVVLPTDQTAIPVTQSGTWTTGRTWTLASGTDSVSVVQSTSPWVTKDQADGPVTPGAVASFSQLAGGQFNTALPTLTNTQQSALQLDSSGRLIISPVTVTAGEDKNYGTVGANTLRTAAQIGNATGAADFNFGTVGAQTLRVAAEVGNATGIANFGAGATGAQTLRVEANQGAAGSTSWLTTDLADGPVAAGTAATKSMLMGGQFNTTLPTLTTGQQAALQTDSSGRLLVSGISQDVAPATVNITARDIASTITVVANGQNYITGAATANSTAAFAFTSECTVVVQVTGAWTGTLQVEISLDSGTTWSPTSVNQDGTDYTLNAFTGNFTGRANVAAYTNFRLRATTAWTGTATVKVIESVNQASVYIANAIRLTDQGGSAADISPNNDLQVVDIIDTAGQNRAQSVTTTAAEALGAGSILANRKSLTVCPTNGTVYWGYSNAVTTANGTPIFKNQTNSWAIGPLLHVWLICASGTVDCRITEGSQYEP